MAVCDKRVAYAEGGGQRCAGLKMASRCGRHVHALGHSNHHAAPSEAAGRAEARSAAAPCNQVALAPHVAPPSYSNQAKEKLEATMGFP